MIANTTSQAKTLVKNSEKRSDRFFTIEEYYACEGKSLHKHEYHNGKIILRQASPFKNGVLASRMCSYLENFNEENNLDFNISTGSTKIRIEFYNKILYSDGFAILGNVEFFEKREDTITNPILIVEVLSLSTSKFDKTSKFEMYRSLPSFKEYVLVYQDREQITVWTKQNDGSWLPKDYLGLDSIAILNVINNCPIELARLYRGL